MAEEKKVDPVAAAYEAIGIPTDRISNLLWAPSASRAALTGLSRSIAPVLNVIGNKQISPALKLYASEMKEDPQFAVGYRNKKYDDYRMATADEWRDPAFQAALVAAHQAYGGWPVLEIPLKFEGSDRSGLYVDEGYVKVDGAPIFADSTVIGDKGVKYGDNPSSYFHVYKYSAINDDTYVPWTERAPALGNNWTVRVRPPGQQSRPGLFVHESYNPAPGGGSRRSRRHKRRNYIKKQKKRTRKH